MKRITVWFLGKLIGFCETLRTLAPRAGSALSMLRNGMAYRARPDDLFIVTYPKSGTTWMQNIVVQLFSGGKAEFRHINQAAPAFDDFSGDMEALLSPRIFKSHMPYEMIPKNGPKYIYITRHGLDVAVSYYHPHRDQLGYHGSFSAFYERFLQGRVSYGPWFSHVAGWRNNTENLNVLFVSFEEMKDDLEGVLRKVAAFCGVNISDEALPQILRHCSFDYMKTQQDRFDMVSWRLMRMGMNPGNFIRKGEKGQWQELLDERQLAAFRDRFQKHFPGEDDPCRV